jgi:RNA polymerase sigma-70 factor (ECF subfamily)
VPTVSLDPDTMQGAASAPPRALRALEQEETMERVGQALLDLSETLRVPLVLRDMDGLSYEEIAEDLGIGLSAVKMRIKRGREEFRRVYAESLAATAVSAEAD